MAGLQRTSSNYTFGSPALGFPTYPYAHLCESLFWEIVLSSFPSMLQTRVGQFPMAPGLQKVGAELRGP